MLVVFAGFLAAVFQSCESLHFYSACSVLQVCGCVMLVMATGYPKYQLAMMILFRWLVINLAQSAHAL